MKTCDCFTVIIEEALVGCDASVKWTDSGGTHQQKLDPRRSQAVRNHSPDGFNHGYGGSGPAQLALAICLWFFEGDIDMAEERYQEFKWRYVVGWKESGSYAVHVNEWLQ